MDVSLCDQEIIEKISRYCEEIDEAHATFHKSYDAFVSNSVYRNAVCLCLMQIGELANHLSDGFKETYRKIPWRAIRGMRNVVAHWETAKDGVSELTHFCEQILRKS